MPLITFEAGVIAPEIKQRLLRELTETAVRITGAPLEYFMTVIREWPDDQVAVAGKSVTEIKRALAAKKTP